MSLIVQIEKKQGAFFLKADFQVDSDSLAVLGQSGAGKSLLLKCIAGIESPDRGKIIFNDRILFDSEQKINLPPQKRRVGYLFQNYALFPNMTVYQNISVTAKNKTDADFYIKRFGLCGKEMLFPAQISGGEQQRVALARLLASEPDLLLFDEPFSALDSNRKSELERLILNLLEEKKCPSILVTHDRNEAFRLSNKIAVMEKGKLSSPLEKHDFFENPGTLAAASLSGCKNISRLQWKSDDKAFALDWGIMLGFEEGAYHAPYAGFRAHYLELCSGDSASDSQKENIFSACIKRVIEDAFSYTVYFEEEGADGSKTAPHSLIHWEISKSEWKIIEASFTQNKIFVKIPRDKVMLLDAD